MKTLEILTYPDERLRQIAKKVTQFDKKLHTLVNQMIETMYAAKGIGLAATQVNQHISLFVMDTSENQEEPRHFINPVIDQQDEHITCQEGCLSVPDFHAPVTRSKKITLRWQNVNGDANYAHFENIQAICIQHEMDHLKGKLFVDYLGPQEKQDFLTQLHHVRQNA